MLQQHLLPTHNVMIEKLKHLCRKHRALDFLQYITSFICIMVVFLWIHYSSLSSLSPAGHFPSHHVSCYQQKGINNHTSFNTHVFRIGLYIHRLKIYKLIFLPLWVSYHPNIVCTTITQIVMSWVLRKPFIGLIYFYRSFEFHLCLWVRKATTWADMQVMGHYHHASWD